MTTGKLADVAPASILTTCGTEAIDISLELSVTAVIALGARETLTVSVPDRPFARESESGVKLVTTGGGRLTLIATVAVEPFTDAVTFAVPTTVPAVTTTSCSMAPAGMRTLSGTVTMPGASFTSETSVS